MREKNVVTKFYTENKEKFVTKRQASKYLNQYGKTYKEETGIPLDASRRGKDVPEKTPKSANKKVVKKNK